YDGGAYIETVLRGDKAKGTDMHSINAAAIGCSREVAKVFFYAMIYGSGDMNLGVILGLSGKKAAAAGKAARARLMKAVPALGKLVEAVKKAVARGYIVGLDGRRLVARAENAALNTLLQSAGAVQMKRGLVILVDACEHRGWEFGRQYAVTGRIHDEWQTNVYPDLAEEFGQKAVSAIRLAGEYYDFRCPLDGQFKVGNTWKETH
ncbi:MAG: DNA polymerase, partial [Planctomycetota bacterium]